MIIYRLSKYNPEICYSDEWTSITDIGDKRYNLTVDEYLYYEKLYIKSLLMLVEDDSKSNVRIEGFEKSLQWTDSKCRKYGMDKAVMELYRNDYKSTVYKTLYGGRRKFLYSDIPALMKVLLREEAWFEIVTERYRIDVGYDYYIHVYSERILKKPDNFPEEIFMEKL